MSCDENEKIASIFETIADALEFLNENAFKIRAYRNAVQSIRDLNESIIDIYAMPKPKKIEGIGKDLEQKIKEYIQTKKVAFLDELLEKIPYTLFKLKDIRGLGPRTLYKMFERYRVRTLEDVKKLVFENDELKDISLLEKSIKKIREGIELYEQGQSRISIGVALPIAKNLVDLVYKIDNVIKVEIAGSLRRGKETVGDIDILICTQDFKNVSQSLTNIAHRQLIAAGETKVSLLLSNNIQVDFRLIDEKSFPAALQYFTGSKEHNVKLRDIAIKKGYKLNEYGLFANNEMVEVKSEEDIYSTLGLCYIKPTLRENKGEIEACFSHSLPDVVELSDIRGDLHVHSHYSDGLMSLEEIVQEAINRKYEYIAITDHSQSSYVASGLSVERLYEQLNQIDKLKAKYKGQINILAGSEVDIKQNGELDFDDNVLKDLDIVIASIHQGFNNSKDTNTMRMISAIENPYVNIIGHPTGRLIGQRQPYELDIYAIVEKAAKYNTALEVNSFYLRLDLNDEYCRIAKQAGAKLCINTDTHTKNNLDYMIYGVLTAQRGWVEKKDVINTLSFLELKQFLKKR